METLVLSLRLIGQKYALALNLEQVPADSSRSTSIYGSPD